MPFDESNPPPVGVAQGEQPHPVPPAVTERESSHELEPGTVVFQIDREGLRRNSRADEIFITERIAALPEHIVLRPGVQLLIGPNGSGKSTLLSAMYYRAEEEYLGGQPEVSDSEFMKTGFRRDVAKSVHVVPGSEFDVAIYFDGAESDPFVKQAARRQAKLGPDMERAMIGKMFAAQRKESSRESKDAVLGELSMLLQRLHQDGKRALLFIDEFENGLDPRRHLRVKEIIEALVGPQDTAIIATNSPILFTENFPRLDFAFPEIGMHGAEESMQVSPEELENRIEYYRFTKKAEKYINIVGRMFYKKPEEWSESHRKKFEALLNSRTYQNAVVHGRGVTCYLTPLEGAAQQLQSLVDGTLDLVEIRLERTDPFSRDRSIDRTFGIGRVYISVDKEGKRKYGTTLNTTDEIEAGFQEAAAME